MPVSKSRLDSCPLQFTPSDDLQVRPPSPAKMKIPSPAAAAFTAKPKLVPTLQVEAFVEVATAETAPTDTNKPFPYVNGLGPKPPSKVGCWLQLTPLVEVQNTGL